MVASLTFIVLLRLLAGVMVWVMIVMVILVLGYGEGAFGASRPAPAGSGRGRTFPLRAGAVGGRSLVPPPPSSPPAGIFHCYLEYAKLKGEAGSDVSLADLGFQTDLRVYLHLRQTWLAFSESPARPGPGTGRLRALLAALGEGSSLARCAGAAGRAPLLLLRGSPRRVRCRGGPRAPALPRRYPGLPVSSQ